MELKKFYTPDPMNGATAATIPTPTPTPAEPVPTGNNGTVNSKPLIPVKDNDFGDVCKAAADKWKTMPQLTLLHITQTEFETLVNRFNNTLGTRQQTGGNRSPLTQRLKEADKEIQRGVAAIKSCLHEKYGIQARFYYSLFGIERVGRNFQLPADRNKRKSMLPIIKNGLVKEELTDRKYGTSFWDAMEIHYNNLLAEASQTDGTVSVKVVNKNVLRDELETVLTSLINLVRANYPHSYTGELRSWGFIKNYY